MLQSEFYSNLSKFLCNTQAILYAIKDKRAAIRNVWNLQLVNETLIQNTCFVTVSKITSIDFKLLKDFIHSTYENLSNFTALTQRVLLEVTWWLWWSKVNNQKIVWKPRVVKTTKRHLVIYPVELFASSSCLTQKDIYWKHWHLRFHHFESKLWFIFGECLLLHQLFSDTYLQTKLFMDCKHQTILEKKKTNQCVITIMPSTLD